MSRIPSRYRIFLIESTIPVKHFTHDSLAESSKVPIDTVLLFNSSIELLKRIMKSRGIIGRLVLYDFKKAYRKDWKEYRESINFTIKGFNDISNRILKNITVSDSGVVSMKSFTLHRKNTMFLENAIEILDKLEKFYKNTKFLEIARYNSILLLKKILPPYEIPNESDIENITYTSIAGLDLLIEIIKSCTVSKAI